MRKIAVILYGQPGSGKGTQADLLAKRLNMIHFDTGRFLEAQVNDPKRQKEKVIRHEKKLFDSGILMTPSFVLREVKKETKRIAEAGWSVVFSGSPRTLYEVEGLLPELEKRFGKKNIFVFELRVDFEESTHRNSNRKLCSFCKAALLSAYYPKGSNATHCPVCGGSLYKRTLDDPEVIKKRLVEYTERTRPVMDYLKKCGYKRHAINGTGAPFEVFQRVWRIMNKHA